MDLPTFLSAIVAAAEHGAEAAGGAAKSGAHAGEEHHRSELPFFVAGGMLATFAVIVSVVGFKKPEFPADETATRGVMLASVLLVVSAMFTAIYVAL